MLKPTVESETEVTVTLNPNLPPSEAVKVHLVDLPTDPSSGSGQLTLFGFWPTVFSSWLDT